MNSTLVVWCGVVQCGAVQYGVVQCGAVQYGLYGVVQCGAVQYGVVQCSMVWCSAVWCGAVQCSMVWCSAVQVKPHSGQQLANTAEAYPSFRSMKLSRLGGLLDGMLVTSTSGYPPAFC